jgi:hypothetical protein
VQASGEISPILRTEREASGTAALRLAWTGDGNPPLGRMLVAGALPWAIYAVLHLVLDGIVLDEATVPAQIITGAVRYPDGHPLAVLMARAPSLSYQLAALEWWLHPGVAGVSAVRNLLFLFLSTFVPFAAALVLTRRPWCGHLAAVLTLSEGTCRFIGVYLLWIFPSYWSSGHFGIHLTVLVAVLLLAGCWRTGGVLLGLLPAVHAAMALVAWPWGGAFLLGAGSRGRPWRRVLVSIAVGVAGVAAMLAIIQVVAPDVHPVPPYDVVADGDVILRSFLETTDPHRRPIEVLSPAYLVSPIGFAMLACLLLWPRSGADAGIDRGACAWLVLLGGVAWAWVFATRLVQAVLGWLPVAVLSTMPGRFAHVPVLLLLPLTVAAFVRAIADLRPERRAAGGLLLPVLLACQIAGVLRAPVDVYSHFVVFLWGALLGVVWCGAERTQRRLAVAGVVALGGSLLLLRVLQDDGGAVAFALGLGLAVAWTLGVSALLRGPAEWIRPALAAACVAAAFVSVRGPHVANGWDQGSERTSPEEARLAAWLATNAQPDELLLAPLWPPALLQPKTGHPVLLDGVTLLTMTYMPPLAAPLGVMVRDLFGIDYAHPETLRPLLAADGTLRPTSAEWLAAWRARDCAAWVALRARYGVRLVLAPVGEPMRLPVLLGGERWTVHEIPATAAECAARAPT